MVTDIGKIRPIVKEQRRTYFKLHPDQKKYPGTVITMPNLPDDQYHWGVWQAKGYKTTPQELMPDKKLIKTEGGEWKFEIDSPSLVSDQERKCDICGQICVGDFGLQAHKRKHDKEIK